jgi:hypothetical protein
MNNPRFKVGDLVRYTFGYSNRYKEGELCIVLSIRGGQSMLFGIYEVEVHRQRTNSSEFTYSKHWDLVE